MWGRKAKLIEYLTSRLGDEVYISDGRKQMIYDKDKTITHLEIALRDAEEAMDLLRAKEPPVSLAPVHFDIADHWGEPLEWIDGEPKENGFYFVATNKWAAQGYETTTLFYNPAARCRWMRGDQGNSERFEGEVVAHIKAPEYGGGA